MCDFNTSIFVHYKNAHEKETVFIYNLPKSVCLGSRNINTLQKKTTWFNSVKTLLNKSDLSYLNDIDSDISTRLVLDSVKN